MLSILLIEDDQIEKIKFERILDAIPSDHKIYNASNGEEALGLLKDKKRNPDLIILDLNMPKMNGIEFLEILKEDEGLRHIPVVILTTSRNDEDVKKCYQRGIAGYIMKPLKYANYKETIRKLVDYWDSNEFVEK